MQLDQQEGLDLTMADVRDVQEVVDRQKLTQLCQSFYSLFGVPMRILSTQGTVVAEAHEQQSLCRYVNGYEGGKQSCQMTIAGVRDFEAKRGGQTRDCFTGARYFVRGVECQQRVVARLIMGPYWPVERTDLPQSLQEADGHIHLPTADTHRAQMTYAAQEALKSIADHVVMILESLIQNSHRALLASQMQVESTREYYRELVKKSEHLEQANGKLKEVDSLKSNFLATVSHELRTPLTAIIGYSEMLKARVADTLPHDARDYLNTIYTKADQLLRLISDLLDVSKLDVESNAIHPVSTEPRALLADVSAAALPQANKKNLSMRIEVSEELPEVLVDPERFRQVLMNLVDNAIKFTNEGGEIVLSARRVSLSREQDSLAGELFAPSAKPAVCFAVQDNGVGIPEESQHRVFDAFYQVDNGTTRRYGGTGLGLSIAKRLVEAHGGRIELKSAPGKGSTFLVTVPASVSL